MNETDAEWIATLRHANPAVGAALEASWLAFLLRLGDGLIAAGVPRAAIFGAFAGGFLAGRLFEQTQPKEAS